MATDELLPIFAQLAGLPTGTEVQDELSAVQSWYADLIPGADVRDPVLLSLYLLPMAARQAWYRRLLATTKQYSLPDDVLLAGIADDTLRVQLENAHLSALGISNSAATQSVGELEFVFSSDPISRVLPAGTQFLAGQVVAVTTQPYTLRSANNAQGDANEILIRQRGSEYVAIVPVQSLTAGSIGNVAVGTAFSMSTSFDKLTRITAAISFVGGSDGYSGQELLSRYVDGLFASNLGTREQIVAYLRQHVELGDIRQVSVIGYGDAEMLRDKVSFAPIGGGCSDIYVAFGSYPPTRNVVLPGVRIETSDLNHYRYNISVARDVVPAFLRIQQVRSAGTGDVCTIVQITRGVDTSAIEGETVPQIQEPSYGSFSRFQTANILVETSTNSDTVGATRSFEVVFEYQPGLATAQRLVASRNIRFPGGDTLVRACLPLYLQIGVTLEVVGSVSTSNLESLQQAVLDEIYRAPCRAKLYQSDLIRAMSPYLADAAAVQRIDYSGTLIQSDGSERVISGAGDLEIPNATHQQLSGRTISLVVGLNDVKFNINTQASIDIP